MIKMKALCATVIFACVMTGTTAVSDTVLESRLSALLGQERQALSVVSDSRLSQLTSVPPAVERGVGVTRGVRYDRSFLANQPKADGGSQWQCLSEALYFEARGETVEGMFAVGEVIMNRVDSNLFPNSLCAVINQGTGRKYACQFTYTCDGLAENIAEPRAWERVGKVARMLIDGAPRNLTNGATHYHTKAVNPNWARVYPRTASIGSHLFYRKPQRTASN